jgi:FAD/FMN-containing dehydrogenase
VVEIVSEAIRTNDCVTAAGSQTSLTGASITDRGTLLSMAGMKRIVDVDPVARIARVEPGVTIGELNRALLDTGLQFAPDPTSENDATIGGAIACNASGARSLRYGPTRSHVRGVTVVDGNARVVTHFRTTLEKNTVGFAAVQDPVDWYVGSEGLLGIVVEAALSLVRRPEAPVGIAIPFSSMRDALAFVVSARETASLSPICLEVFDRPALGIAGESIGRPWPDACALIYLECDAGRDGMDRTLDAWLATADHHGAQTGDMRVFDGAQSLREARTMRHAVPATLNERGAAFRSQGGRKVSTDWAVPYALLGRALELSREAVERNDAPQPVTYGHAGNGHPHQNFIADGPESLARIHAAVQETLREVVSLGGTISAEHGLGKLKREWLALQLDDSRIAVMHSLKNALDKHGVFAPGNVL